MPLFVEHGRNKTVDLTSEVARGLRKQESEDVRRESDGRGERCDTADGIELTLFNSRQHRAEHNGGRSVFSPIQQIFPSASASGSGGVSAYQCKYGIAFAHAPASPISTDSRSSATSLVFDDRQAAYSQPTSPSISSSPPVANVPSKRRTSEGDIRREICVKDDCMSAPDARHVLHTRSRGFRIFDFRPKSANGADFQHRILSVY